jgi:hypothetical protein
MNGGNTFLAYFPYSEKIYRYGILSDPNCRHAPQVEQFHQQISLGKSVAGNSAWKGKVKMVSIGWFSFPMTMPSYWQQGFPFALRFPSEHVSVRLLVEEDLSYRNAC